MSGERPAVDTDRGLGTGGIAYLWSGRPLPVRLADLDIICELLDGATADLLVPEKTNIR
ncbi:hypothetical protein [Streptomyces sp. NPDC101150]|uniref:hypothetical protein n=1 Tax=Streptomyces sp. NPDC101150 TaxID=3366114 RepID=UPI0037FCAAFE